MIAIAMVLFKMRMDQQSTYTATKDVLDFLQKHLFDVLVDGLGITYPLSSVVNGEIYLYY